MMKKFSISLLLFFVFGAAWSQSSDTLDFESFQVWVRTYHPVASQAEINLRMGDMEVRQARGSFDPKYMEPLIEKSLRIAAIMIVKRQE
jgi:hypothetical protein